MGDYLPQIVGSAGGQDIAVHLVALALAFLS
jgi:hypothetical protein